MPTAYRFIPTRIEDILAYLTDVSTSVTATPTNYGLVSGDATALATALTNAKNSNTALIAAIADKKNKTEGLTGPAGTLPVLVDLARTLANKARSSTATDQNLADIGIYRRDPAPTPVPAPTTAPVVFIEEILAAQILIGFKQSGVNPPRAKPDGVIGVQLSILEFTGTVPNPSAFDDGRITFVSRTPKALSTEGLAGSCAMRGRWQTARGLTGPWSSAVLFVPQTV